MKWTVRRATPADAGRIAEIKIAGWRSAYRGLVPGEFLDGMRQQDHEAQWAGWLAAGWVVFLAIGEDGVIGAFAYVAPVHAEADRHPRLPTGELGAIYTDPRLRGEGAGTAVHDAGLEYLAAQGFRHAVLWVLEGNAPSRRWYESRGWRCDGVTQPLGPAELVEVRYSRQLSSV